MAVTNSSSSAAAQRAAADAARRAAEAAAKKAAEAAAKKAAEAAAKKAAEAAAKKAAAALERRKDSFQPKKSMPKLTKEYTGSQSKDVGQLAGGKGETRLNRDGSQTTSRELTGKNGSTTKQSLTTQKSLGESKLKFSSERTEVNGNTTKHGFESTRDVFGNQSSKQSRETSVKNGDTTQTNSKTTATDVMGRKTVTNSEATAVEKGNLTTTDSLSHAKGYKTDQLTLESTTERKNSEKSTTTTTVKGSIGQTNTASAGFETNVDDGTFGYKKGEDWKKGASIEASKERARTVDDKKPGGFGGPDTAAKAQKAGDLLAAAGLKTQIGGDKELIDTANLKELKADNVSFAGAKTGTQKQNKLEIGADGASGSFTRGASAGLYAQKNAKAEGDYGTASYKAGAKLEAKASVDGQFKVNANGIDASVGAKAGVSAEASFNGKLESKPVKFLGADLTVGVEGNAKVAAQLQAEATAKATITRNPPTAILEGKAGASAVVKAEADVKVNAGPFSVKASAYVSAGAEAQASGVIGYQDGKLKIGGSIGAALGVGAGTSVAVEVDVKQIGTMAYNAADVNNDGKLGLDDVGAAASKTANAVGSAAVAVGSTVANAASSAASAVGSTVSGAASKVAGWFGW